MIDMNVRTQIEDVVRRKVAGREMFTAWDITREVRALNPNARIFHDGPDGAKLVVHEMFGTNQMGVDYLRTLRNVGQSGVPALVYYPFQSDPSNYGAIVVSTITGSFPSLSAYTPAAPKAKTRQSDIDNRDLDRWGRVRVPSAAMRDAGFQAGDTAYVIFNSRTGEINLYRQAPSATTLGPDETLRTYQVDCYLNVRMQIAHAGSLQQFGVESGQGIVTIAPKVAQVQQLQIASVPALVGVN